MPAEKTDKSSQKSKHDADVAIVGGGLVGLTLGIAVASGGLKTVVVDALDPAAATDEKFDGRVCAIAFASCRMFEALGLWRHLAGKVQPINDIVVSDGTIRGGASSLFLHFDHREIGDAPLGHIIENRHIRLAQQAAAAQCANLEMIAPASVERVDRDAAAARIHLDNGMEIKAAVCLAADGRGSPQRRAAGIKTISWSYQQTGIVATVEHQKPHNGVAHEYFLPSGPFAILPMTGNRSSLVWTEKADLAPAYLGLNEDDFATEINVRFGDFLGETKIAGPRWSYPLGLQLAREYVAPRLALVGDAAHGIHPIAGQGLNLGLRDVAALAEVLTDAARLGLDIGHLSTLRDYERWRRFDNVALAAVMDVLNRLFSNDWGPLRLARDVGLGVVNQIAPLRRFFMSHAGGDVGTLPRLLRGEPL